MKLHLRLPLEIHEKILYANNLSLADILNLSKVCTTWRYVLARSPVVKENLKLVGKKSAILKPKAYDETVCIQDCRAPNNAVPHRLSTYERFSERSGSSRTLTMFIKEQRLAFLEIFSHLIEHITVLSLFINTRFSRSAILHCSTKFVSLRRNLRFSNLL